MNASTPVVAFDSESELEGALSYSSDCNCACPTALSARLGATATPPLLELHRGLRRAPLAADYELWFAPSQSRVAAVNAAAARVLGRFGEPHTWADMGPEGQAVVATAYRAGLLDRPGAGLAPPPPPDALVAWLHVTNACNLRCTYCYVEKSDAAMSEATGTAAVDAVLRSALRHGYRTVKLKYAGGEAALNMPLVSLLHEYAAHQAAALGIAVTGVVLSNGTVLTRHRLREIRRLGLALMISLDGMGADHDRQRPTVGGRGSFQRALDALERAQEEGLDPTVSITVTGASVAGLPELLRWLLPRGLRFTLNFYRAVRGAPDELRLDERRLIEGLRAAYAEVAVRPPRFSLLGALLDRTHLGVAHQRTCGVGDSYIVIDHDGKVAKCQMELASPVTTIADPDPLGVIRLEPRGVQNLPVDAKVGCRECEWRYWCAGGCALETFRATGRYDLQSPNCAIYRALYPEVLRLEGLRILHHHVRPAAAPAPALSAARSAAAAG